MKIRIKPFDSRLVIDYCYLFLLLYQPTLFGVTSTYYLTAIAVIGLVFETLINKSMFIKSRVIFKAICGSGIVFVYLFIRGLMNSNFYSYLHLVVLEGITVLQVLFLIQRWNKNHIQWEDISNVITNIGLFQALICIIMVVFPSLRMMQIAYIFKYADKADRILLFADDRLYGIAGPNQYLYGMSLVHGMIALLAIYKVLFGKGKVGIVKIILILVPTILVARVGLVCFVIGLCILLVGKLCATRYYDYLRLIIGGLLIVGIIRGIMFLLKKYYAVAYDWVSLMLSAFWDILAARENTYGYNNYSKLYWKYWVLPQGSSFVWGTSVLTRSSLVNNDSGYIRLIYIGGVVLLILVFLAFGIVIFDKYRLLSFENKLFRLCICAFLCTALFKGNVYCCYTVVGLLLCFISQIERAYKST